ncbi:hypothetical protein F3Y22_tig00112249pilonHSYRG00318 [Hibiscus syriacus]|uniref:Uncharacterized protein n=1 Tax=Hibiscus syriacus TaxID=106335 RepID=A0A6A2X330_HIBSY|nr:hypothetical protein F3Y22_tig00112249pilonHSYRG00318 [Hibiscus syriacus]
MFIIFPGGASTELPLTCSIEPLGGRPLEGEHDCRLGLLIGPGSTEEDRELGVQACLLSLKVVYQQLMDDGFGVAALDTGLEEDIEGLAVGVDDLVVDLVGVADLAETVGLVAEDAVLAAETVGLVVFRCSSQCSAPSRFAGLEPGPPDDEGLRTPVEFDPGDKTGCFAEKLLLAADSGVGIRQLIKQ